MSLCGQKSMYVIQCHVKAPISGSLNLDNEMRIFEEESLWTDSSVVTALARKVRDQGSGFGPV